MRDASREKTIHNRRHSIKIKRVKRNIYSFEEEVNIKKKKQKMKKNIFNLFNKMPKSISIALLPQHDCGEMRSKFHQTIK